jgi:CRISPR-associated protein Cmr4
MMKRKFESSKYLLQTLDPVHIGTGGMRLGGVDNTIVRETGTNLPKIPGSSLSGVIRSYAAYQLERDECAGSKKHCKSDDCQICYTFGTDEKAGVVRFTDARILMFPVHSMTGPIWISSPLALLDSSLLKEYKDISNDTIIKIEFNKPETKETQKQEKAHGTNTRINLNWLMLNSDRATPLMIEKEIPIPQYIKDRTYLVSNATFSQVINSNLEVRTSVSIDPKTGTAEDKALFTYEAIPRACLLWTDIVIDEIIDNNDSEHEPKVVIDNAMQWLKDLGLGGMGSRGFGRVHMFEWK